jgi:cytochrome d ubiquinol oxidase subunit II
VQPEIILLLVVFAALTLYALLGGADFGAGVWEVNTALKSSDRERAMLHAAIGPVWEANHVWLILVLVTMFAAFPVAFAGVFRALWLPLLLALTGVVFRGIGFAFRTYTSGGARQQAAWDAVFAIGSTAAPFFLGASVGAVASGKLAIAGDGGFDGNYLTGWISSLSLFTGFFVVGMCAFLSSVYLAREISGLGDRTLVLLWRRRALTTGGMTGILALAGIVLVATGAPLLWEGFRVRSWPLVCGSMIGGFASLYSLVVERYRAAVVCAAIAVSAVIWAWGIAQFPMIVPPTISLDDTKAPANVLWLLVATIGIGALLLFPALGYLLYLFKTGRSEGTTPRR